MKKSFNLTLLRNDKMIKAVVYYMIKNDENKEAQDMELPDNVIHEIHSLTQDDGDVNGTLNFLVNEDEEMEDMSLEYSVEWTLELI